MIDDRGWSGDSCPGTIWIGLDHERCADDWSEEDSSAMLPFTLHEAGQKAVAIGHNAQPRGCANYSTDDTKGGGHSLFQNTITYRKDLSAFFHMKRNKKKRASCADLSFIGRYEIPNSCSGSAQVALLTGSHALKLEQRDHLGKSHRKAGRGNLTP
jgi:hypothetical protein